MELNPSTPDPVPATLTRLCNDFQKIVITQFHWSALHKDLV